MNIAFLISKLKQATSSMESTAAQRVVEQYGKDPFIILVSCILSLRTTDRVSFAAAQRLFSIASTPQAMVNVAQELIAKIIFPVGFYKKKAYTIKQISCLWIKQCNFDVVLTVDQLLEFPGVGRKTANLVVAYAYDIPAICVDTHVHRISNRLGLVKTKTVNQTEEALQKIIPQKYWLQLNSLLVMWGQNICRPQSPFCSICPLNDVCPKVGVVKNR